ncbi:hypothetical protein B0T16DRAFT_495209 [Cercophora newfieldiana]|uniref:Uncharacterized protein n=1 Tax=Cercophora newfieldiana TaxID=92897 RepID=A0AA39Y4I8_9PEZI|nr:hypothetical protein B0T16DRAFT_495209 [Cercophora newfieldiana]
MAALITPDWYQNQLVIFQNGTTKPVGFRPGLPAATGGSDPSGLESSGAKKRKAAGDWGGEAINDWEHGQFPLVRWERAVPIKKRRSYYFRTYLERSSLRHGSPSHQSEFPAEMNSLADQFGCLGLGPTLHSLPDEIVLRIAEYLVPEPVDIGLQTKTSLMDRDRESNREWDRFFSERADIIDLSMVSRRLYGLVNPLLHRNIFLSRSTSLCRLVLLTFKRPSLAEQIRHINCAIDLEGESAVEEVTRAMRMRSAARFTSSLRDRFASVIPYSVLDSRWKPSLSRDAAGDAPNPQNTVPQQGTVPQNTVPQHAPPQHTAPIQTTNGGNPNPAALANRPRAPASSRKHHPWGIFLYLLTQASRLTSLNVFHARPPRELGRSTVWMWFLDDENPFVSIGFLPDFHQFYRPTREQLWTNCSWPPAFLRNVTVETSSERQDRSFIHVNLVPRADAADHQRILNRSGLESEHVAELLKPSRIHNLSPSEHVNLLSYLDGLKRIPEIANGSDELLDHIDHLKTLTYHANPESEEALASKIDIAAAQELARTLNLFPSVYSTRLSVRSKALAFGLNEFLRPPGTARLEEDAIAMRNTESLELRYTGHFTEPLNATPLGALRYRLLRTESQFSRLKRLRLMLKIPRGITLTVYGLSGRLRGLQNLPSLRELTIPMEGLFGSTRNLNRLFGGTKLTSLNDEPYDEVNITETDTLENIVLGLPTHLETLRIVDWYHEYADPSRLLPAPAISGTSAPQPFYEDDRDCIRRLSALQKAVMAALSTLAPVLATQTKVKNVVFWVHRWNEAGRDAIWREWSQGMVMSDGTPVEAEVEGIFRTSSTKNQVSVTAFLLMFQHRGML